MMANKAILLLSGGIDSTTLLAELTSQGTEIHAISFDYGQKHGIELVLARQNAQHFGVKRHIVIEIDNSLFRDSSSLTNPNIETETYSSGELSKGITSAFVPARNLMFVSHAASYAEAMGIGKLYLAFNGNDADNFPDCSKKFVVALNKTLRIQSAMTNPLEVVAPFIDLDKSDVIRKAIKLGVDLHQTISCYAPVGMKECGNCLSCITKKRALELISS